MKYIGRFLGWYAVAELLWMVTQYSLAASMADWWGTGTAPFWKKGTSALFIDLSPTARLFSTQDVRLFTGGVAQGTLIQVSISLTFAYFMT